MGHTEVPALLASSRRAPVLLVLPLGGVVFPDNGEVTIIVGEHLAFLLKLFLHLGNIKLPLHSVIRSKLCYF